MIDILTLVEYNEKREPVILLDKIAKEILENYPDLEPGDEIKCNKFRILNEILDADCIKFDIDFVTNEKIFYFNFKEDDNKEDEPWLDRASKFSKYKKFDKERIKVFWHPNNDSLPGKTPITEKEKREAFKSIKHQKYISYKL